MSNVAKKPTINTLVPFEIHPKAKSRNGDEPDNGRIEEIRRRGIRPGDAERIERLERELDLEDDFSELRRVWAASVLRANPDVRTEARRRVVMRLFEGDLLPYDALQWLHNLELIDEDLDFARLKTEDAFGKDVFELVLYEGRHPKKALKLKSRSRVEFKDVSRSAYYARLPE